MNFAPWGQRLQIRKLAYASDVKTENASLPKLRGKQWGATQRAKITEKVHKPPRNHYIEPIFSDIGLNCESQGEKGRTCK